MSRAEALVLKFRPDLSARLKDIAEKQISTKLKPIVSAHNNVICK